LYFRLLFAYTLSMFNLPDAHLCDFIIRCKACGENVPAPVATVPDMWIIAACPLCGAKRRYLPEEIFRGKLSWRLSTRLVPHKARSWTAK
jgi:hypothetical protein